MQALVTNPNHPIGARFEEVALPKPSPRQVLVQLQAISLNRGEVRDLPRFNPGIVPGWDASGIVVQAEAIDGIAEAPG